MIELAVTILSCPLLYSVSYIRLAVGRKRVGGRGLISLVIRYVDHGCNCNVEAKSPDPQPHRSNVQLDICAGDGEEGNPLSNVWFKVKFVQSSNKGS